MISTNSIKPYKTHDHWQRNMNAAYGRQLKTSKLSKSLRLLYFLQIRQVICTNLGINLNSKLIWSGVEENITVRPNYEFQLKLLLLNKL